MGNDGGSIPDRRDLVRNKPKAEQADKANQTRARWLFCALSKRKLQEPVVSCGLGKLYNKDAILEYLLDKSAYGDGQEICGHIRSLKEVKTLVLTPNTSPRSSSSDEDFAQFVCPLTLKEMNGSQPFLYLWTCGCVFSQSGFKALSSASSSTSTPDDSDSSNPDQTTPSFDLCPRCSTKYSAATDILILNPNLTEEAEMRNKMAARHLSSTAKPKKRKAPADEIPSTDLPAAKKQSTTKTATPHLNPAISAASRAVVESLAAEEAKRKEQMSEAIKSVYGNKDGPRRKETFMTMATFTRYA